MKIYELHARYNIEKTKLVLLALRRLLDDLKVINFKNSSFDSESFIKKYKVYRQLGDKK